MAEPTIQSINNSILALKKTVASLQNDVLSLQADQDIYATKSDLSTEVHELEESLTSVNSSLSSIETKLQKISLPTDTRYYLEESEITSFRNHYRQLRAMMAETEKSRVAMIRLMSRYNLTNSSL